MKSPFEKIDRAFAPFYDETITIESKDGSSGTFLCCCFTDGTSDPLTDDMMETDREDMTFVFMKGDLAFVKKLQRGATIQRMSNSKKYSVSESKLDNALGWVVTAREA